MTKRAQQRIRRSALYTPASNARALQKLASLDCDAVILDLEDAVAPSAKIAARNGLAQIVPGLRAAGQEVVVRCNGLDTPWGEDDLAMLAKGTPDAVLAPKIGGVADLARYAALLPPNIPVWAMIETCQGVLELAAIARAPRVEALVFGANDLLAQMGARDPAALRPARTMTVLSARAAGIAVLDGVYNHYADDIGLAEDCERAAALGFDGKTLIHPRQIAICNRSFSPSPAQVAWAKAVAAAFTAAATEESAVLSLDGAMIERLHLAQAERVLAAHEVASSALSA